MAIVMVEFGKLNESVVDIVVCHSLVYLVVLKSIMTIITVSINLLLVYHTSSTLTGYSSRCVVFDSHLVQVELTKNCYYIKDTSGLSHILQYDWLIY